MKRYLTKEGLERFKKELEYLEKIKWKEVSERIRQTAAEGDLKENAGYDVAKEEQGFMAGRIKELKSIIAQAEIIGKQQGDKVQIGSIVYLDSKGEKETFQVVGPEEADILKGKISFKSPLGEKILAKKKGDTIKIDLPDGKKEYKIIKVE